MTKEEIIKEAYGDCWGNFNFSSKKCALNNNGWISQILDHAPYKELDLEFEKQSFRPKSLKGIENNNGWIKIESESDLPKIGQYDMSAFELFYFADKRVIKARYCTGLVLEITHYRLEPLIKPQPPIY